MPDKTWVQISSGYWFYTVDTTWCIAESKSRPKSAPNDAMALPFACRGTIGNDNLSDTGLSGAQSMGTEKGMVSSSVFTGSPASTTVTVNEKTYQGRLWRLAGIPGWNLAVWEYATPPVSGDPFPSTTFVTYDAKGRVQAKFSG